VAADTVAFCRHRSRVERVDGVWRLRTLYAVYQRDTIAPVNPADELTLDAEVLAGLRESYRYLSYWSLALGSSTRQDLPGDDRPDLVAQCVQADEEWLTGGGCQTTAIGTVERAG
jgi:hypothetical protein